MLLTPPLQKVYYTLFEAQCMTGMSQHSWRSLVRSGQITCIHGGRRTILIPKAEIERYLQQHTKQATASQPTQDSVTTEQVNQTPVNGEGGTWRLRLTRRN